MGYRQRIFHLYYTDKHISLLHDTFNDCNTGMMARGMGCYNCTLWADTNRAYREDHECTHCSCTLWAAANCAWVNIS